MIYHSIPSQPWTHSHFHSAVVRCGILGECSAHGRARFTARQSLKRNRGSLALPRKDKPYVTWQLCGMKTHYAVIKNKLPVADLQNPISQLLSVYASNREISRALILYEAGLSGNEVSTYKQTSKN